VISRITDPVAHGLLFYAKMNGKRAVPRSATFSFNVFAWILAGRGGMRSGSEGIYSDEEAESPFMQI
jgi:hypothetical protein